MPSTAARAATYISASTAATRTARWLLATATINAAATKHTTGCTTTAASAIGAAITAAATHATAIVAFAVSSTTHARNTAFYATSTAAALSAAPVAPS